MAPHSGYELVVEVWALWGLRCRVCAFKGLGFRVVGF